MSFLVERNKFGAFNRYQTLRSIVSIDVPESAFSGAEKIDPKAFSSRFEYRKALIEQRKRLVDSFSIKVYEKLLQLGLKVLSSPTNQFFIVEASLLQITQMKSLKEVKSVTSDCQIQIDIPEL